VALTAWPEGWTGQHLQALRRLTDESAAMLMGLWQAPPRQLAKRNPTSEPDELMLTLDLNFRLGRRVTDDSHPEVIALSDLLNAAGVGAARLGDGRVRASNESKRRGA